jgi:branched-chain amino acid transport system permease protein
MSIRNVLLIVGFIVLAVVGALAPSYYAGLLTLVLVYGMFAMSLNVLVGYTGLDSLGHAAFYGAAAYGTAIAFKRLIGNPAVDALLGIVAAFVVSAVFGLFALRATGAYFLMATLALAQVLLGLALGWRNVTGGDDGLPGIARPTLGPLTLTSSSSFFLFVLVIFALITLALWVFSKSPFGYALLGIRESESRMQMLGYNTWLYKYIAFVVAGTVAGVSGVLYVFYTGFISSTELTALRSAEALLMVILGGPATLLGPLLGAAVVVFLQNMLSSLPGIGERWQFILGAVYVLTVLFAPNGIVGEIERRMRKKSEPAHA